MHENKLVVVVSVFLKLNQFSKSKQKSKGMIESQYCVTIREFFTATLLRNLLPSLGKC